MNLIHNIARSVLQIQPKLLASLHRLYYSDSRYSPKKYFGKSWSDAAYSALAYLLPGCSTLRELNRLYARAIRSRFLEMSPRLYHWNTIMRSYTKFHAPKLAVHVYISMLRVRKYQDSHSMSFVLKAICIQDLSLETGHQLHSTAIKNGLDMHEYCETGIINFYSKLGDFEGARKVFDENPDRELGSWNAIIGGLSQGGYAVQAINMFKKMMSFGYMPSDVTMVNVISACGSLNDLDLTYQLHKCILQAKNYENSDTLMLNSLIDAYAKCGRTDLANKVFIKMENKTVSSWTIMIMAHAMERIVNDAMVLFRHMENAKVTPNHLTFVGVLSACAHGGMVREGRHYFDKMKKVYNLKPRIEHYGCMVDLLSRAKLFEQAKDVIEEMPMKPNNKIWGCLMDACWKHKNMGMAEWAAKHLQKLEPWNVVVKMVLSRPRKEDEKETKKEKKPLKISGHKKTFTFS